MTYLSCVASLAGVGLLVAACGASAGHASGDSDYLRRLHAEAVSKGYDEQATLLADGQVSFSELREADNAIIECAKAQGAALKATQYNDLYGLAESIEPVDTGPVDADFVNGVLEKCQKTKQELVARAYGYGRADLSDTAYSLFAQCATNAGHTAKLPRSLPAISAKLGPDAVASCTMAVINELHNAQG